VAAAVTCPVTSNQPSLPRRSSFWGEQLWLQSSYRLGVPSQNSGE
jgi:hypothetical protein